MLGRLLAGLFVAFFLFTPADFAAGGDVRTASAVSEVMILM
jgi:hypothetical protein